MNSNENDESRKQSVQLTDSPEIAHRQKHESIQAYSYDHEVQAREKQIDSYFKNLSDDNIKVEQRKKESYSDSTKNTPQQQPLIKVNNVELDNKVKEVDIDEVPNRRLMSRLNTYDLRQQFFKNENQYPQHLFIMNSYLAQWGRLQDNIKAQYQFLKQENEVKIQILEDLKIYQLKMIKNNLKYKFLLKERSRQSMVHDIYQEVRSKMKINIQNFETDQKRLVDTINKNQDLLKSMMLKIAQNPLLLAYILEQNNQYDNSLDQFLDDVNSLFYERVLVDSLYQNPIYILQSYLIERELSKAETPEDVFKMSNLSTKTIYAFTKNINCAIFLEKVLYNPLKTILSYPQLIEINLSKLYEQLKKKPKLRRAAVDLTKPQNIDSLEPDESPSQLQTSLHLGESQKFSNSTNNSQTHSSKNPISYIKNFFKSNLQTRKAKCNSQGKRPSMNESSEDERSESSINTTFTKSVQKDDRRTSTSNSQINGRKDKRRRANLSSGGIVSQNQLRTSEDISALDSDIMGYLKKKIEDLDLYVAIDVHQETNYFLYVLKLLVGNFMNEILFNVRNFPKEINIMCCILKRSLLRRFPLISNEEINCHLGQFVFNKWIFQDLQLISQRNIKTKKEQEILSKNFQLVNTIAQRIIKQQPFESNEFPICKLNDYILSYKSQIDHFYEIICSAENVLIDAILDKANLESYTIQKPGQSINNSINSSSNQRYSFSLNPNQQQVQDITSLAFSLEDLKIISFLISKMPDKLEKFDPRLSLFKEAQRLQDKLRDVFKDNTTSRNSYYFCWEVGTNQSTGYIEKLFQVDYGLTKKERKDLNQEQLKIFKIKEMLILFLLSIDSILYLMQLKRGQSLDLIQILDEYKIKQIDHIINIRQNQPKVQMDIYLEYLQLLLSGLPENFKKGEYECILQDICLTLDRKFQFLTQQILAYKQLYLQKKNIIKCVVQFVKNEQNSIIKKNIKQNILLFVRTSYINIKIITAKTMNQETKNFDVSFEIIQNEEITVQDTQTIARKKQDMEDEYKVISLFQYTIDKQYQSYYNIKYRSLIKQQLILIQIQRMVFVLKNQQFVYLLKSKLFNNYFNLLIIYFLQNSFINYLVYTPELVQCLDDRSNLQRFNQFYINLYELILQYLQYSFNQLMSDYLDLLERKVNELPFYKNMKEDNRIFSFELIQQYISRQIFLKGGLLIIFYVFNFKFLKLKTSKMSRCLPEKNTTKDVDFIIQSKKYSFMSEKHQSIERLFQEESMWEEIANDIRKINFMETHIEKLNLIVDCWNNMVKVLMMVPGEGTGADDCLPVWIHILLKAQPDKIHTNINFIELMLHRDKMMQNETTYVFTQFQSAVEYIHDLTEEKILTYLRNAEDQQKFTEHCIKFEELKAKYLK